MNRPTIYFAVDEDGTERVFEDSPLSEKDSVGYLYWWTCANDVALPKGTIKKLTGKAYLEGRTT